MEDHNTRLKRLRMRSWHRGIKEMDLILGGFADDEMSKLSLEEFIEQTSDFALNDLPLPGSDEFNALYNFYSFGVDMLREFAETPRGIGMTILSKEGLNIIPDKQVLNDFLVDEKNKEIGLEQLPTILMISRLGESLDSMEITLKANPGTN